MTSRESRIPTQWQPAVAIFAASLLCFSPILGNDWVNLDDQANVHNNKALRGEAGHFLVWPWTCVEASLYRPFHWYFTQAQFQFSGLIAYGYHLASLLLHAATAVALYFMISELIRWCVSSATQSTTMLAATWATLFYALHPLRVEPVAWFSSQAYMLAAFFGIIATTEYLKAHRGEFSSAARRNHLVRAYLLLIGGLLSQPAAVTVPFVWIILDIYPLGRWRKILQERKLFLFYFGEKLLSLFLAGLFMGLAVYAKAAQNSLEYLHGYSWDRRLAHSASGLVFGWEKTFAPFNLHAFYETPLELSLGSGRTPIDALVIAVLIGVATLMARRHPGPLLTLVAYTLVVLPHLGFVQIGRYLSADRYTYFPSLVLAGAMGVVIADLLARRPSFPWKAISVVAGLILVSFATLSAAQCRVWQNSLSLWSHSLAVNGDTSAVVRHGLALASYQNRDYWGAIDHDRRAIEINPEFAVARLFLAQLLAQKLMMQEALTHAIEVVRQHPENQIAVSQLRGLLEAGTDNSNVAADTIAEANALVAKKQN